MSANLRGDRGTIEVATAGADARVPLVLGDDGRQLGEFGDLMPARLGVARPRLGGQRSLAVGADRGQIRYDDLDPLWRKAMAMMSGMPRLAARFPPRGCLDDRLGRPRRIGRRGRGAIGGIASNLREEFSDLGFQGGDPGQGSVEFSTQPGAFRALRAWSQSVRNHDEAAYTVAGQEQGLNRPAKQNRCRRQTERLPNLFVFLCLPRPPFASLRETRNSHPRAAASRAAHCRLRLPISPRTCARSPRQLSAPTSLPGNVRLPKWWTNRSCATPAQPCLPRPQNQVIIIKWATCPGRQPRSQTGTSLFDPGGESVKQLPSSGWCTRFPEDAAGISVDPIVAVLNVFRRLVDDRRSPL